MFGRFALVVGEEHDVRQVGPRDARDAAGDRAHVPAFILPGLLLAPRWLVLALLSHRTLHYAVSCCNSRSTRSRPSSLSSARWSGCPSSKSWRVLRKAIMGAASRKWRQ